MQHTNQSTNKHTPYNIKKVAVLGAGVMGAQIAAHLVNCRIPVVLFDLPSTNPTTHKSAIAKKAIDNLQKLKPSPLAWANDAQFITPANYDDDMHLLTQCDLVIEAIAERMDWKLALYATIAPHVAPDAIVASNTSGLGIHSLSKGLPADLAPRFCGIHFFNPPRHMHLVELIDTPQTDVHILDNLETFITTTVGKGVVRALDTPNFIANRIGIAGILSAMTQAQRWGLSFDVVDDLTGKKLGRASSGTFRTADVVGLDTMNHVIGTLQTQLTPETDPFHAQFGTPVVLQRLLDAGHLGQKTGAGFFKKDEKTKAIWCFSTDNITHKADGAAAEIEYTPSGQTTDDWVVRVLKKPAAERLPLLRNSTNPQAQFVWAVLRDSFHYAAVHLGSVAHTARDVDLAMRWGFGAQQGPFELWQEAGWLAVAQMVQEDIEQGKALCAASLPKWVFADAVVQAGGVHTLAESWSAIDNAFVAQRHLPVYDRQYFPQNVAGCTPPEQRNAQHAGTTVFSNTAVRLWHTTNTPDVLIATLQTKMHTLNAEAISGLYRGLELAQASFKGLVIYSGTGVFSAGADLQSSLPLLTPVQDTINPNPINIVDDMQHRAQQLMMQLRYANVPVVCAILGLALGGGCEMAMHASHRVAALESQMGLVEVGVGLLPGAGGLTHIARHAAEQAVRIQAKDLLPFLMAPFMHIVNAKISTSALEAKHMGYLQPQDVVVPNPNELLFVAIEIAKSAHAQGYRPPMRPVVQEQTFAAAGRSVAATLKSTLLNLREGGFISAFDYTVTALVADVLCGGDVDAGTPITESQILQLERQAFVHLLQQPKTQERIVGMLNTGKPVRN